MVQATLALALSRQRGDQRAVRRHVVPRAAEGTRLSLVEPLDLGIWLLVYPRWVYFLSGPENIRLKWKREAPFLGSPCFDMPIH